MIGLLEATPDAVGRSEEARTITLTWQSSEPIEMSAELQGRWHQALQSVLRRGWRMLYLCRLNDNGARTIHLVEMMRGLVGMGEYLPRYFTPYGVVTPPYDLLIIPGVAAVALFSGASPDVDDNGIVIRDPHGIGVLQAHARQLAARTTPLLTPYFASDTETVEVMLREAETRRGERVGVNNGLSVITQPEAWFSEPRMAWTSGELSLLEWKANARIRGERIAAFKRRLQHDDCSMICAERAIERLARTGVYPANDLLNRGAQPPSMRVEHLRNVVSLLRAYPRFHLALVSAHLVKDSSPAGIPIGADWVAPGDRSVFIDARLPDASDTLVSATLHITEPTVADAFNAYFHQLWERIPPPSR
ncbi:MAG: hypothetical protein ACRDID_14990 [Ktedonobacterales bacterium]